MGTAAELLTSYPRQLDAIRRLSLSPDAHQARERHRGRTIAEPPSSPMTAFRQRLEFACEPTLLLLGSIFFGHFTKNAPSTSSPVRYSNQPRGIVQFAKDTRVLS